MKHRQSDDPDKEAASEITTVPVAVVTSRTEAELAAADDTSS